MRIPIRRSGAGNLLRRAAHAAAPLLPLLALALSAEAQQSVHPSFAPGETLVYHVRMGALASGRGEMRVRGPEFVSDRSTYLLSFEVRGGFGPFRMEGRTHSWVDAVSLAAVRFHKYERSPFGSSTRTVDLLTPGGIWRDDDGDEGKMPTTDPLDELSFLYYVRSLPLPDGARYGVARHFEQARNPVIITVAAREHIRVPAGSFDVVVVDMQVPGDDHLEDGSSIRLYLTDDDRRVPVRIESSVRHVGRVVLTLESPASHGGPVAGRQ